MGIRTTHGPGTFCWADLPSTDPDAAKKFYAALLGWEYHDRGRDNGGFSMARRYDANVAAIYELEEQERVRTTPPHWNTYISVDDADAPAARAAELGGSVLDEPYDVSDAGRTAVIIDPAGARFWVWQPRAHIGAGHVNDAGCLTWSELSTDDPRQAIEFYTPLFGWTFDEMDTSGGPGYWVIRHENAAMGINGGMRELTGNEPDARPAWMPYFTVDSAGSATEIVAASGGGVQFGPTRVGAGTIAVVTDPDGAVFGVYEGEVDD